jgi:hypothetical protein
MVEHTGGLKMNAPNAINWTIPPWGFVDASDLGLRAGEWPLQITVTGPSGEVLEMYRHSVDVYNADHLDYKTLRGELTLRIFND